MDSKAWVARAAVVGLSALALECFRRRIFFGRRKKVFVSGCFDLMHSGHVAFFKEASELGDVYVSVGNDANIMQLKKHAPMFPEAER